MRAKVQSPRGGSGLGLPRCPARPTSAPSERPGFVAVAFAHTLI